MKKEGIFHSFVQVKAGASVETRNAHGETSLDIAQPSLKSKLVAAVKARAAVSPPAQATS